jgi:hypothetical protein
MKSTGTVIDVHTHFIPQEFLRAADHPAWQARVEERDGGRWIHHEQGFAYPLDPGFLGGEAKFEDMRRRGIDISVCRCSVISITVDNTHQSSEPVRQSVYPEPVI